jgi:UDP-glucose 4-epimerase
MPSGPAAVIGARGFLGAALVDRLVSLGVPTLSYSRSRPFVDPSGRIDGALTTATTVYWLVGSIRPATADDHEAAAADRQALRALVRHLRATGSTARLVTIGSGGTVYDTRYRPPYAESARVAPVNGYGLAMRDIEQLARRAPRSVVLRVANAYGPGQPARRGQGVIAHWLRCVAADEPVHMIGSDELARDYVYIQDVVDAFVRAHVVEDAPATVNIGSGQPTSLGRLLRAVRATVAPADLRVVRHPSRGFDAPSTWLDVTLAARRLGWRPSTPLAEGLAATWEHVIARSDRHSAADAVRSARHA